jgi:hypothetical protein
MRRACLLFGIAACWSDKASTTTQVENHAALEQGSPLIGGYWCTLSSSGYTYDPYPCVIKPMHHHLVLAKLGGSQRFTGEIRPEGSGFVFRGEFYCPWGDCTQAMNGVFVARGGGFEYEDDHITVHMVRAPEGAFGGTAYGGDGYGGFGYGGDVYGQPNRTGRRNPRP